MYLLPLTELHDNVWAVYNGADYLGCGVVDDFGFVQFLTPAAFYFFKSF